MARHTLENRKNRGFCKELRGNIHIRSVFVDEPDYCWKPDEKLRHRTVLFEVTRFLRKEAEKCGVPLQFNFTEEHISGGRQWMLEDAQRFSANYGRKHNCASLAACGAKLRRAQNANQAAFVFLFKIPARSFAPMFSTSDTPELSEAAFMYGTDHFTEKNILLHELLHVFGAADFYYPETVKAAALRYFPHSVMLDVSAPKLGQLDNFTKYLIGWANTPARDAALFMKETASVTDADVNEANKKELLSKPYAVVRSANGTYYGPIRYGCMHGKGKYIFKNGDVYEGDFTNGRITGYGTVTFRNGKKATGYFENGVLQKKK